MTAIISTKSSGNWQPGSWLGSYFQHKSGWIYHLKLGWCYLIEGTDDWVWLWHNELGWMGTSEYLFPFVFINEQNDWSYLNTEIKDVRKILVCFAFGFTHVKPSLFIQNSTI